MDVGKGVCIWGEAKRILKHLDKCEVVSRIWIITRLALETVRTKAECIAGITHAYIDAC